MLLSSAPETRYGRSPPAKYSTQLTPFSWPSSVKCGCSVARPHTLIVRSREALANVLVSFGLKATIMT